MDEVTDTGVLVTHANFDKVIRDLESNYKFLSLDTETTGLYPFHGDRLFSIIIGTDSKQYYFNFHKYDYLPLGCVLWEDHKNWLQQWVFNKADITWFIHKAIFDVPMLHADGFNLAGDIHCTVTGARIQYNEHNSYTLASCGSRIGFEKNMEVEAYIKSKKLYSTAYLNGISLRKPRYDLVPFDLMFKYGCVDAKVGFALGDYQIKKIQKMDETFALQSITPSECYKNELALQKVLNDMQIKGVHVDTDYCRKAIEFFQEEMTDAKRRFFELAGTELIISGKCFSEVFRDEADKWEYTDKSNPSFPEAVLKRLVHPGAREVLRYKEAKAKINFFLTFIKFTDEKGFIHTELKPYGTRTGRFSSANPNLQNLKKEHGPTEDSDFVVRRAVKPRPGYFFAMIDYDQIEYRLMLDYARADGLISKVLGGLDVHTATAEQAGVDRSTAKTVNFLTLYGGGIGKLASTLGVTKSRAKAIQSRIFDASPEIRDFIDGTIKCAERRGYIFNWLGRISHFPKRQLCYKAPNTLIQGGAGDVCKVAMVECHKFLKDTQSRVVLNIHDELIFEMHAADAPLLTTLKKIMEGVYKPYRLPLTCGIEYSWKSLADKVEFTGLDDLYGSKPRDEIQAGDLSASQEASPNVGKENPVGRA